MSERHHHSHSQEQPTEIESGLPAEIPAELKEMIDTQHITEYQDRLSLEEIHNYESNLHKEEERILASINKYEQRNVENLDKGAGKVDLSSDYEMLRRVRAKLKGLKEWENETVEEEDNFRGKARFIFGSKDVRIE